MALSDEEVAYALELFAGVSALSTRKMFGGLGIYSDGRIFAILVSDGSLRIKAQGEMIQRFQELGMQQWTYKREGQKPSAMPYWDLPDDLRDDSEAASALACEALTHL